MRKPTYEELVEALRDLVAAETKFARAEIMRTPKQDAVLEVCACVGIAEELLRLVDAKVLETRDTTCYPLLPTSQPNRFFVQH